MHLMIKYTIFFSVLMLLALPMQAQQVKALRTDSRGDIPRLEWYLPGHTDSMAFQVFRSAIDVERYSKVNTSAHLGRKADTLYFTVLDSTLTTAGIYRYYLEVYTDGDTLISEMLFAHTKDFVHPPEIVRMTAHPVKDRKAILLEWELREARNLQGIAVFRSTSFEDGYELVAQLPGEAREYTDMVPRSNEPYFYFLILRDFFGYQQPGTRIHGFSTYAREPLPPVNTAVTKTGEGMALSWQGIGDDIIGYNIYRKAGSQARFTRIATQYPATSSRPQYLDTLPLPDEGSVVSYYCTAVSDGFLESRPGDTVFINLVNLKPPLPPSDLNIIEAASGFPLLIWQPGPTPVNTAGYHVYRRNIQEPTGDRAPEKRLNTSLLPSDQNHFTDSTLTISGIYEYAIESVNPGDVPAEMRVRAMYTYKRQEYSLLLSLARQAQGIELSWVGLQDPALLRLHFYRQTEDATPVLVRSVANQDGNHTDTQVKKGMSYTYFVIAEYNDGTRIPVNSGSIIRY